MSAQVCFISSNYGGRESTCKRFKPQTIKTDFICFTDNPNQKSNGWIIDTTPYHLLNKSLLDNNTYINSIENNKHTFNVAKYYKQAFQNIPRLKNYDVVVWLDGTIEILNPNLSKWLLDNIFWSKIVGWEHDGAGRKGSGGFHTEMKRSVENKRYSSTGWMGQPQPFQDVGAQYRSYIQEGYNHRKIGKVWLTCFVAFWNQSTKVTEFLNEWYLQTLKYTTQDQIGFPYACYKCNLIPHTVGRNRSSSKNKWYKKHTHRR